MVPAGSIREEDVKLEVKGHAGGGFFSCMVSISMLWRVLYILYLVFRNYFDGDHEG